MRILIAGATGAIGRPLVRRLKEAGHAVFGLARAERSAKMLSELGARAVIADATNATAMRAAIARVRPDAVLNELTSLPEHYTAAEMKAAAERDRKVRVEGNANLLAVLGQAGVPRYILQSSGFWYAPGADSPTSRSCLQWTHRPRSRAAVADMPSCKRPGRRRLASTPLHFAKDSFTARAPGIKSDRMAL